ncbi:hypothetical protein EJB05_25835, partial [Eragrostis curvula]
MEAKLTVALEIRLLAEKMSRLGRLPLEIRLLAEKMSRADWGLATSGKNPDSYADQKLIYALLHCNSQSESNMRYLYEWRQKELANAHQIKLDVVAKSLNLLEIGMDGDE